MCGIWAIFGFPDYFKHASHAMNISGRGPDCFRMETIPHFHNCCLAFHRLAINGDEFAMQPLKVKSLPHLYLIYNGEIYNHSIVQEKYNFNVMTQCDGEVILHLYDKLGAEKAAQMLDGIFAFCIVDTKRKQVHLGRDTFGIRPLFTLTKKGKRNETGLALCSEVKSLVPIEKAIEETETMNLAVFQPGHYASFNLSPDGMVTLIEQGPYTYVTKRPVFETRVQPKSTDHFENIRVIFTEAVRKRLMADRRIGCLLSGGLDSSLVAALLMKLSKEAGIDYPIQTFSVGMEGGTDVTAARRVAEHIGSEHHEVIFTEDEGIQAIKNVIYTLETYDTITIRGAVGLYILSNYISKETNTVVLYAGEGSDELCQGYIYFHKAPSAIEADKDSRRLLNDMYAFDIVRIDRTTSAHGLEVRLPFLDVDFTSHYLSLPPELRQPQNGVEKWLLRQAFNDTNLLPSETLWRTKEGFSDGLGSDEPGKSWFEIVQEFISNRVPDEAIKEAKTLYPFNTPTTKESFYYRQIFEEFFSGCEKLIPYFWMPRWIEAKDPSQKVLGHFKTTY